MIRPSLAVLTCVLLVAPSAASAGVEFKRAIASVSDSTSKSTEQVVFGFVRETTTTTHRSDERTLTVRARGGSAVVSLGNAEATYVLYRAGRGVFVVDPSRKVFAPFSQSFETTLGAAVDSAAARQSRASRFFTGGRMRMETKTSPPRFEIVTLPDEAVGDRLCRHVKLLVRYTHKMRFMKLAGWTSTNFTDSLELWLDSGVAGFDDVPMALGLGSYHSISDQVDVAVWTKIREIAKGAFPVRQRIESSSSGTGGSVSGAVLLDATDLRSVDVDESEFDIPAGFDSISFEQWSQLATPLTP